MAKPKKTQNRLKTENHFGTSHTRKMYESEDEDICPVCEGECTCNNITESVTAYSFEEFNRQQQQSKAASTSAATSSKIMPALPKGFRPSSSKGLGPASYATVVTSPSPASKIAPRLQSLKLKIPSQSKHDADHTLSDSSNSTIDAPSGPQLARFSLSKHANGGGSGSITPRHALDDRISPTNGHTGKVVPPKVIAKSKGKGKQSIDRKPTSTTKKAAAAATVKKPTTTNPKKPTLVNSKKRKLGRPHKKRVRETTSESSLSDFDDFDEDDFVPFRGSGPVHKKGVNVDAVGNFPTFVSASVFGDSGEDLGSSSSSDSETTGLVFSGDSEMEEEEERMIVAEEKKERQRKFKELIMNTSHQKHMGGGAGGQQWQIKPRRKSVEGEESVDDETASESGAGEEEEEEEDDPDEDDADGEEQAAAWSTDDSDEDFFFANLSDSSISFSADQDDDDDSETVSSTADLAEAASAGFLSGMGMPMVVMDDFGMELSLGGVLNATDLDQEFEQRARAQLAEEKRTPGRETTSPELDFFGSVDYTREALEAVDGLEMDLDSDATEYEEDSDMDGDTTADEMEHGRTPARFRFPTPPSINPLSTFSPSPAVSPVGWRDFTPTHFNPPLFMRGVAPVTPHARAASFGGFGGLDAARARTISASAVLVNGSDGSVSASEVSSTRPVMGSFGRAGDRRRAAIIDGNAAVPSPFAARRRRSDSWKSGRKHFGSKSDIFPMLARRARGNSNATSGSTPSSFHFPTTETELDVDMDMDMDMEESCTEPFELDDVLDFSNVSDDHSHTVSHIVTSPTDGGESHLRSLDRWDRVPMGTFRRTRETHDAGVVPNVSTPDGFSYGATSRGSWKGGMLWSGGLSVLGEGKEMLGPVGNGDSLGNSEDATKAGQCEKAMSRKERRHRKKREAASTHVPTKSFITPPPSRKE
ncbi:unnamed protein product [Rhizoctonia solani]|uniref:Uncharacterized protein n=1 Tax=Rhizoctonia solani TaxID=456999 RepID=A0A8H3H5W7_9AGAM|nr:unnamed protein product [Rhizoctonia solani]